MPEVNASNPVTGNPPNKVVLNLGALPPRQKMQDMKKESVSSFIRDFSFPSAFVIWLRGEGDGEKGWGDCRGNESMFPRGMDPRRSD